MNKNLIITSGFVSYPKNFGEVSTANLGISINTAKKDEEPIWKYLNIQVEADLSEVDFTKLEDKRLQVSGFISGNVFTPKDSDKEVVNLKLVKCKVKELAEGEKAKGSVEMETRVSYLREFGENGIGGSCSRSFSHKEDYKYINFSFSGNREKLDLYEGDIVQITGFLSADFYTPKGSDKEIAKAKIVFISATKVDKNESSDTNNDEKSATKVDTNKADTNNDKKPADVPEIDIDDDEIPF